MTWFDRFRLPFGKKAPGQETADIVAPPPAGESTAGAAPAAEQAPPVPIAEAEAAPSELEPCADQATTLDSEPERTAEAALTEPEPSAAQAATPFNEPERTAEAEASPTEPESRPAQAASPSIEPERIAETERPQAADAPARKGFWAKAWEVLNTPIPGTPTFGMDRELIGQIAERLSTTRKVLVDKVRSLVKGRSRIDEDLLEELEELLLESDMGLAVAEGALAHLRAESRAGKIGPADVTEALATYLKGKLGEANPLRIEKGKLQIILLVGVNGTGKTTTLGKLAYRCQLQGYKVVVAAADTFRAAAIDQLEVWADRAGVPVIRHAEGGDAAAVVFDAIAAARARGADVVLVDTAGRLHNKANLMAELAKIRRIVDREAPDAPKEVLLVLDATTGQNGLRQAEVFGQAVNLTGVVLTKLDGTAKGGVIFAIKDSLNLPVRLVGLGEGIEDLRDFDPEVFVDALFAERVDVPASP